MKKNRILIIDDEQELRNRLYFFLDEQGFEVQCCHNGEEGIKAALETNFDLILLDYNMPGMNGDKVLDRIKEEKASQKIVFLTGNYSDEANYRALGREYFPEGFLYKPFDLMELKNVINDVINGVNVYKSSI